MLFEFKSQKANNRKTEKKRRKSRKDKDLRFENKKEGKTVKLLEEKLQECENAKRNTI